MAKLRSGYTIDIPIIDKETLYKPIVFVVDMVNGFMKEGSLCDASILEVASDIKILVQTVKPSIFICDSHDLNAREFEHYPIHCVRDTTESNIIDELQPYVKRIVFKNSVNAFHAQGFQTLMAELLQQYQDIVIVGCWSEGSIMQFALSLQAYFNENNLDKHRIVVPYNMIETFHMDVNHNRDKVNEMACTLMRQHGIDVVELR